MLRVTDLDHVRRTRDAAVMKLLSRRVEPTFAKYALAFSPSGRAFVTKAHATRE